MAYAPGTTHPPAYALGVDVMQVRLPRRDTYRSFINTFTEQLTPLERESVSPAVSPAEGLKRFFWLWTMKEAYTKALGLGLGFDFSRIEFDVKADIVRVDGKVPQGWKFHKFEVKEEGEIYVGVVAELLEGLQTAVVIPETEPKPWFKYFTATSFVEHTIEELSPT
ncbi:hypothetical protein D9757_000214 [Collybiopsis confluens]|uniref:holo-[acyl-carrier-protein] synthase n=1 Tax=Collybiopsis confluens TaxID=2823264 RepID=A0A8H5I2B8_9AGAR|nr:hypothetical protein D9757_000214 [Collybiopsis confluens]